MKLAILNALALARTCFTTTIARFSTSDRAHERIAAENQRLKHEVALLREEIRLKDARLKRVPPRRRPHYSPTERMSILELRALRGWSITQTALVFLVSRATVSSWMSRAGCDEDAGVRTQVPVNRFPDFVRYLVQRLKVLSPQLGKVKIAQILCRAGLHLGSTTVGRILKEPPAKKPHRASSQTLLVAEHPDHVWHIDLTTIPTGAGFWTPYFPFSLPQRWPFCWWIAVVLDQFSRRVIGFEIFRHHPDSSDVCGLLERLLRGGGRAPQVLVSDGEGQFTSDVTVSWCDTFGITPRVGHLGQHGGIAILDRFFRTLKEACALWTLVPLLHESMRREIAAFTSWYNSHRPHTSLEVRTPDEIYHDLDAACERPRVEPRARWPAQTPCASLQAPVDSQTRTIRLSVGYLHGRRGLPIVTLQRAA